MQAAAAKDQALPFKQAIIDKLTHENALLKRMKFAAQPERLNPEQMSLLEDEIEADLAAVVSEIDALQAAQTPASAEDKKGPKRLALPAHLPPFREALSLPMTAAAPCTCASEWPGRISPRGWKNCARWIFRSKAGSSGRAVR